MVCLPHYCSKPLLTLHSIGGRSWQIRSKRALPGPAKLTLHHNNTEVWIFGVDVGSRALRSEQPLVHVLVAGIKNIVC
jgi:hypothetical protein